MRQQVQPDRNTSWRLGTVQPYWPSEAGTQTHKLSFMLHSSERPWHQQSVCLSYDATLLLLPDNFCIFGERSSVLWDTLTNLWRSMFSLCSPWKWPTPKCALRAKLAQPSGKAGPECYSAYVFFLLHQFITITEITLTHYCVMKTQSRATNAQSTPDCPNITQSQSQDICNNSTWHQQCRLSCTDMPWLKQFAMYNHISKTNYNRETTSMTELSTTLQRAKDAHKVSRKKLCDLYVSPSLIIAPILLSGTLLDFFTCPSQKPRHYLPHLPRLVPSITPGFSKHIICFTYFFQSLPASLPHSNGTFLKH